jgi:HAMP domain-containing protein
VRRPRFRLGLLARVALAFAAVGLLPLWIASRNLAEINGDALYEQVLHTHITAARSTAERIGELIATRDLLVRAAAGSPELADPGSPVARGFLARSLGEWTAVAALAAAVVDSRGELVVRAQVKGEGDRVEAALRPGVSGFLVSGAKPPVLRFAAPLAGGVGSLVLIADAAPLREAARPLELERQAQLVVADRSGRLVVGSLASLATLPAGLVRNALSARLTGSGRYQVGGEKVVAAYHAVPGTDWVVISLQPAAAAEAVALRMRRRTLFALGAAGLLILALSGLAWAFLVRPIRELTAAQRSLVGGGAGGAARASGGDEIADLRQTFELLRRSLSERRALDDVFLGRYQVTEALGTGAMGTVFRGWDPRLQRPVALKTIKLAGAVEPDKRKELIATLTREAVTVARLSHPNVVAVYDLEEAPETAFVAMELVDGMTLEALLASRGQLTPDEVIPLGAAIARGLAAAHAQGIVHRDVKPANVLLGKDGSIKVSDFGIAGVLAASAASEDEADVVFGTPGYLPPESLRGQPHGRSGDLFALGVVLYACLSSALPFGGTVVDDILRSTLFGVVRPLRRHVPDIPADLESLIEHLLDRDVTRRPSSAEAVAAELERMAAARSLRWNLVPGDGEAQARGPQPPRGQWIPTTPVGKSAGGLWS